MKTMHRNFHRKYPRMLAGRAGFYGNDFRVSRLSKLASEQRAGLLQTRSIAVLLRPADSSAYLPVLPNGDPAAECGRRAESGRVVSALGSLAVIWLTDGSLSAVDRVCRSHSPRQPRGIRLLQCGPSRRAARAHPCRPVARSGTPIDLALLPPLFEKVANELARVCLYTARYCAQPA